ncbi:MAG: M23 family metallopeptidase [Melioribacteraceae bacterium]|nr:M23 family metallopeptidase [Melioribacteraceae bacterium]
MTWFNFKELKKSSVYITPNLPVLQTKRYKFGLGQVLLFMLLVVTLVALITILLILFTPVKEVVLLTEKDRLENYTERIKELEDKIVFLSNEISELSSTNKKLKYAILLGGGEIDSNAAEFDSLRIDDETGKIPEGGTVLFAFLKLWKSFLPDLIDTNIVFLEPINSFVTQYFNQEKGHLGWDYAAKTGSPVYAAAGGLVLSASFSDSDGYWMMIDHGSGYITKYKHCSNLLKKEREYVYQGELIALTGNTGKKSSGPHLHFEVWHFGKALDPSVIFRK